MKPKKTPECHLCGDTYKVPYAYINGKASAQEAFKKVPCPRCKDKKPVELKTHWMFGKDKGNA